MVYRSGTVIANRYEVVQSPHEKRSLMGGMGLVYLCVDHAQEGRPVALKTFKPEYLPNRDARDRFAREGTTWVELGRHPHIVRCYDVIRSGVGLEMYLVLGLVAAAEGKEDASLRAWLRSGKPLPMEQALMLALHIARGMKHATMKISRLVHRDLKPENVLVGRDGSARVTDFGLAQVLQADDEVAIGFDRDEEEDSQSPIRHTRLTRGVGGGTPEYMAPEQWERRDVDRRADIYALGCILLEMLTGQMPVRAVLRPACRELHRSGQALKAARGLPDEVQPVLTRCLAVRPDERYTDWGEVEAALANAYRDATGKDAPVELVAADETRAERVAAGWSFNVMGTSYMDIGKFQVAAQYFERVVRVGQAEKERALEGIGLGNLGLAYYKLGDYQRAIEFYGQSLAIAREIGDRAGEGFALGRLGAAYRNLGDYQRAIESHEQDLAIAREIGDRAGEGAALSNLGSDYDDLGGHRRAIEFYGQALAIAREIGDRAVEGATLGDLGIAYRGLGDHQRAIEFCEQALAIARETGDRAGEGHALGNLGVAYYSLGDHRRAIEFHEQRLAIAREIGDRAGEGAALGNLGVAYDRLRDFRRAIEFYEQRLAIAGEIGDVMGAARTSFNLASLLSQQGQAAEALRHAEFAAQVFTQMGHAQYAQMAQQLIAQIRGR